MEKMATDKLIWWPHQPHTPQTDQRFIKGLLGGTSGSGGIYIASCDLTSRMSSTTPASTTPVDTASLSTMVRHYLKTNQIQWGRFSSLVLGVSQPRLSTLLSKPQPWHLLKRREQALYQRMQLWMDTRATYGNNPYYRERSQPAGQSRGLKGKGSGSKKRPRSLFEMEENLELLEKLENFTAAQGLVEENGGESQIDGVVVIEHEEVIEDGIVQLDMEGMTQECNQVVMMQTANQEGGGTVVQQSLGDKKLEEQGNVFTFQLEEEVNQMDKVCQVLMEDPDLPGTYKLTFVQVTGLGEEEGLTG